MNFFDSLTTGARFKREDSDAKKQKQVDSVSIQADSVDQSLDFFNIQPKQESKKRKAQEVPSSSSESDSESIVDIAFTAKEAKAFNKANNINTYGSDVPNPIRSFSELFKKYGVHSFIQRNLKVIGHVAPTSVQMQSFPIMLEGRDLMACAPTGSGKTLSFILPILQDLKQTQKEGFRAVIISPSRELAQQKLSEGKTFKICVLTKTNPTTNDAEAKKMLNYDILISTPLRLVHLLSSNLVKLDAVRHLVLDEADRLLELGFLPQMDEILTACTNPSLQKSLYTATLTSTIEALAQTFMKDPIRIVVGQKNTATKEITQKLLFVGGEEGKMVAFRQMVKEGVKPPVLVFVQSIERAKELFNEFIYDDLNVDMIHSERTRAQRDAVIENFRMGKIWVLITTELMARGIDFKGVNLVINYDFPQSVASYIHRIGRTGRAGRTGEAITYFTKDDAPIVTVMKESGCEVPDWMNDLKKPTKQMKKDLKQNAIERRSIKTISKFDEKNQSHRKQVIKDTKAKRPKANLDSVNQDE